MKKLTFLLILLSLPFLVVSCNPQLGASYISEQEILIAAAQYEDQAERILSYTRFRVGADYGALAVFTEDNRYRMLYIEDGEDIPTSSGRVPLEMSGYDYLYQEIRDGQSVSIRVEDMVESSLKSQLLSGDVEYIHATPIRDSREYIIGYLGYSWNKGSSVPERLNLAIHINGAADEITSLSKYLSDG